jgi:hypothetical protein
MTYRDGWSFLEGASPDGGAQGTTRTATTEPLVAVIALPDDPEPAPARVVGHVDPAPYEGS